MSDSVLLTWPVISSISILFSGLCESRVECTTGIFHIRHEVDVFVNITKQ